jgi:hypothetical protein
MKETALMYWALSVAVCTGRKETDVHDKYFVNLYGIGYV